MKNKSLLQTNAYLRDPAERKRLLTISVLSSTTVEGVTTAAREALGIEKPRRKRSLTVSAASASGK